jgi:hypothetical protein
MLLKGLEVVQEKIHQEYVCSNNGACWQPETVSLSGGHRRFSAL